MEREEPKYMRDQYGTQYIEVWHIKNYMILHWSWLNFSFVRVLLPLLLCTYAQKTSKTQNLPFSEEDSINKKWKCWPPPVSKQQALFCVKIFTLVGPLGLTKFCVLAKGEPFHVSLFEGQLLHTFSDRSGPKVH